VRAHGSILRMPCSCLRLTATTLRELVRVTLGSPKPTTYQHYLTQAGEKLSEIQHWEKK